MCRQLAYLGPPVSLAALVLDPPHSLLRQSYAPADMRGGGTVNADGFGVGWYTADGPVRYRRDRPLWTDEGFAGLARSVRAGAVLAAVRSATVGMPVTETACAPFADGRFLFGHNGRITNWPDSVGKLAEALPVSDLLTLDAPTDSALLWALVRHRLRAGTDPTTAVRDAVADVAAAAPGSRLNLVLHTGTSIVATTLGHALSYLDTADSLVVASEPATTDEQWTPVPDGRILTGTPDRLVLEELC